MAKVRHDHLEILCGQALVAHYSDNPHQTFHHEPSVAAVVLDAVPDGWAKVNGAWVELVEKGSGCPDCGRAFIASTRRTHNHSIANGRPLVPVFMVKGA